MFAPKANSKQRCVKTTQEHEKVHYYCMLAYSLWRTSSLAMASVRRANTAPCHVVARRGEQVTRRGES